MLQGLGPGKAAIRYIGNQEVVQVGEPVFTSGLDRIFPRGLLVGYVSAVQPHDVELQVEVVLAAPLDRIGLVLILPAASPDGSPAPRRSAPGRARKAGGQMSQPCRSPPGAPLRPGPGVPGRHPLHGALAGPPGGR